MPNKPTPMQAPDMRWMLLWMSLLIAALVVAGYGMSKGMGL